MQIPWQWKSRMFAVADVLPPSILYAAQKHVSRRSGRSIKAVSVNWRHHRDVAAREGARRLIEFGAGKDLVQNLFMSAEGNIEQTVVDLNPMIDLALVNRAARGLEALDIGFTAHEVRSLADLERHYRIRYRAPLDMRATDFSDGSFDMCISTDTMEHIPTESLRDIFVELRRILRADGVISSVIDYGDHYSRTDRTADPLNYLRFTADEWKKHNHDCHYQNRLRHGHYARIAAEAGFDLVDARGDVPLSLPADTMDDLLVGDGDDHYQKGFYVWRKPALR